jgi:hypothetical protein
MGVHDQWRRVVIGSVGCRALTKRAHVQIRGLPAVEALMQLQMSRKQKGPPIVANVIQVRRNDRHTLLEERICKPVAPLDDVSVCSGAHSGPSVPAISTGLFEACVGG